MASVILGNRHLDRDLVFLRSVYSINKPKKPSAPSPLLLKVQVKICIPYFDILSLWMVDGSSIFQIEMKKKSF